MKNTTIITFVSLLIIATSISGCVASVGTQRTVVKQKSLPPGQAKKINGDKSAKKYAPGQNK